MRAGAYSRAERCLPLLLLPGTLCDARIFQPLQQRLPGLKTQVMNAPEAISLEGAAEQILAEAPPHFALLGFSLGGMVALEIALRAPERVRGIALLSTTPLPVPLDRHAHRRAEAELAHTMPMRQVLRERLWPEYGGAPADTCTLPLLEQMAEELGSATFARQTEMAIQRADFCPRLHAIACPALVIAGTADVLCTPTAQQCLLAGLPRSTGVMLPNAGHFALIEQPDEVASAVAAWFHALQAAEHKPIGAEASSSGAGESV